MSISINNAADFATSRLADISDSAGSADFQDPSTFEILAQNNGDMGSIHRDRQNTGGAVGGLLSWFNSGARGSLDYANKVAAGRDLEALAPTIRSELAPFRGTG